MTKQTKIVVIGSYEIMEKKRTVNSIDHHEMAHYEQSHQDLHYLHRFGLQG